MYQILKCIRPLLFEIHPFTWGGGGGVINCHLLPTPNQYQAIGLKKFKEKWTHNIGYMGGCGGDENNNQ